MNFEIRCSKLARIMACHGSLFLDVPEPEAGEAAREGTAFGEYLEKMILYNTPIKVASNNVIITDEMVYYATPLLEDIRNRARSEILCETVIDWTTSSGLIIRGKYDVSFIDDRGYLCVEDFKYGYRIVDVKENWQLIGYAIGEVIRRNQYFPYISLKIHQPRPYHEDGESREWIISYEELHNYVEKIDQRLLEISQGINTYTTGKNCRYCKGVPEACTAFNKAFYNAVDVSTQFFQDTLSNDDLSRILDIAKRSEEIIKIKCESLIELGNSRIAKGQIIPNYIQVPKSGYREWKSGVTIDSLELLTGRKMTETVVLSPAKAEKLGIPKNVIAKLCQSSKSSMVLERRSSSETGDKIFGKSAPIGG